jgi:SNF2 family DNA or RNA helicase
MKKILLKRYSTQYIDVIFVSVDFNEVIEVLRLIPGRRYLPQTKQNIIPLKQITHFKDLLPDYHFEDKSNEIVSHYDIYMTNRGYNTRPPYVTIGKRDLRLNYLKRPRDGVELQKFLKEEGIPANLHHQIDLSPLSLTSKVELYPFQEECMRFLRANDYNGLIALEMGLGKAQPLDTPILTTEGFKTIGTVKVGDYVFGRDGKPTKVVAKSPIWKNQIVYEISNTMGAITKTSGKHEWLVTRRRYDGGIKREWEEIFTTEELYNKQEKTRKRLEGRKDAYYQRPIIKPQQIMEFGKKELEIDPYIFGYWLGDGSHRSSKIYGTKEDLLEFVSNSGLKIEKFSKKKGFLYCSLPRKESQNGYSMTIYNLISKLKEVGVYKNKHIPDIYVFSSKKQRLALLQGLMDSDGSVTNGTNELSLSIPRIIFGVKFILDSLGIRNGISKSKSAIYGVRKKDRYRLNFKSKEVFRLKRKKQKATNKQQRQDIYLEITKTEEKWDMQCIQVDNEDHIYLTDYQLLPTRNSIIAAKCIEELGEGPALIVAPASILTQWQRELKTHFDYEANIITSRIPKQRRMQALRDSNIAITNYEFLRTLDSFDMQWNILVLDEIQKIKNWKTKAAQTIAKIPALHTIGLSGTPVEKNLRELYNIIDAIRPAYLGTMRQFYRDHITKEYMGKYTYRNLEQLYERLQGIMYRKRKEDVMMDLPEITRQHIDVPLTQRELDTYQINVLDIAQNEGILAAITYAKIFASSSAMRMDIDVSSKEKEALSIIGDLNERCILFSFYKKEIKRLAEMVEKEVFSIHGDIPKRQRHTIIDEFEKRTMESY